MFLKDNKMEILAFIAIDVKVEHFPAYTEQNYVEITGIIITNF
jgi:hypothetical protein